MIRVHISKHLAPKAASRLKKKLRVRKQVTGTAERPRMSVFRSTRNLFVQIIDDASGTTLVSASTLKSGKNANKDTAVALGKEVAELALKKKIEQVVFDRNGFLYHGRVKALADAAREAGLKF